MDKEFLKKCKKAHANILTCLDEAFKKRDLVLIMKNCQRLNEVTTHYDKVIWLNIERNNILDAENKVLEEENRKLRDELFLKLSSDKGKYQQARQLLDEFYNEKK